MTQYRPKIGQYTTIHNFGGKQTPHLGEIHPLPLPNIDVAHAFFRNELHAGHDGGPDAASLLRGSADGWPCASQLQSGGCKEASLVELGFDSRCNFGFHVVFEPARA